MGSRLFKKGKKNKRTESGPAAPNQATATLRDTKGGDHQSQRTSVRNSTFATSQDGPVAPHHDMRTIDCEPCSSLARGDLRPWARPKLPIDLLNARASGFRPRPSSAFFGGRPPNCSSHITPFAFFLILQPQSNDNHSESIQISYFA